MPRQSQLTQVTNVSDHPGSLPSPCPVPLQCPVRKCGLPLSVTPNGLTCASRHHFDRAKQGYYSLLQPQDRRSPQAGDSDEAVLARQRWLQRGHASGLVQWLQPWVNQLIDGPTGNPAQVIDLGCGEGSFGPTLFASKSHVQYAGIDLSKRAIRLASRQCFNGFWILANADRALPIADYLPWSLVYRKRGTSRMS
ncbi:MAG: putative RNA methyltransferase [Planctomycetota bacterium]